MKLQLHFKNINCNPECSVDINQQTMYTGAVRDLISIDYLNEGPVELSIRFINKLPSDTIVDSTGTIIQDKNFELEKIVADGYNFNELIWDSSYTADHGDTYPSCLFFGPPGAFTIKFENPILPWILKTKHTRYNNDPNWEEDYKYYNQACKILAQISAK